MRILGVDPGTWQTGAGVIDTEGNQYRLVHFEVIRVRKPASMTERLKRIHAGLCEIFKIYRPEVMALENVFFGRDVRAMVQIGEVRACAMLAASSHGAAVVEYPPARVKQAVTGNGRATKEQMQFMIQRLLGLKEIPSPDGADALALAICHVHASRASRLLRTVPAARSVGV